MSDPQLPVDADAIDLDGVTVAPEQQPEPETWLVKASDPRWQVWRDHNRRRPPTRAEKRGRLAAVTAGTIIGVLGVGGLVTYAFQWQGIERDAREQIQLGGGTQGVPLVVADELAGGADMQVAIDRAERANRGSSGLIGIENGAVTGVTANVRDAAADKGFINEVLKEEERGTRNYIYNGTYSSGSSASVFAVTPVVRDDRRVVVVNVVDLTAVRNRLNTGYLAYGLIGLGVAGVSAGAVWTTLGRRLNRKVEPDDV